MSADDRLYELLGRALEPERLEPPRERVHEVRARAEARRPRPVEARSPWRRRVLVAAAAVLAFLGGVVVGHDLPRPLRAVAHELGLPVDSPELLDARARMEELGRALGREDVPAVIALDQEMVEIVNGLDQDEQDEIKPAAHEIHERAVAFLAQRGIEI